MGADLRESVTVRPPIARTTLAVAVGIATKGRAAVLRETIAELQAQTQRPSRIIIAHTDASDVAGLVPVDGLELVCVAAGLCNQRNAILDRLADDGSDIVLFFDDDFLPMPDYIAATAAAFLSNHDIAVTTGEVLVDGIKGPGLTAEYGRDVLAAQPETAVPAAMTLVRNGYGCNMAIRLAFIRSTAMRFDPNLPFYGWLEDVDFCVRAGAHGRIVKLPGARGVHLGVKLGRGSGTRLGYSQVSNPVYLVRKGSMPQRDAIISVSKNIIANTAKYFFPEPYVDRPGRLRGNMIALRELLAGTIRPTRVLDL
jgi:glycosyltransferase involved in cell wall biosynthesis